MLLKVWFYPRQNTRVRCYVTQSQVSWSYTQKNSCLVISHTTNNGTYYLSGYIWYSEKTVNHSRHHSWGNGAFKGFIDTNTDAKWMPISSSNEFVYICLALKCLLMAVLPQRTCDSNIWVPFTDSRSTFCSSPLRSRIAMQLQIAPPVKNHWPYTASPLIYLFFCIPFNLCG